MSMYEIKIKITEWIKYATLLFGQLVIFLAVFAVISIYGATLGTVVMSMNFQRPWWLQVIAYLLFASGFPLFVVKMRPRLRYSLVILTIIINLILIVGFDLTGK